MTGSNIFCKITPKKEPVLSAQNEGYYLFLKNQDCLKSEFYSKIMTKKIVQETDHTITLVSGNVIHHSDFSISLGEKIPDYGKLQSTGRKNVGMPTATNLPRKSPMTRGRQRSYRN